MVPNPEYDKALYKLDFIWHGGKPPPSVAAVPEIRTNNPNFISDGMREGDLVPSHVLVVEDGV